MTGDCLLSNVNFTLKLWKMSHFNQNWLKIRLFAQTIRGKFASIAWAICVRTHLHSSQYMQHFKCDYSWYGKSVSKKSEKSLLWKKESHSVIWEDDSVLLGMRANVLPKCVPYHSGTKTKLQGYPSRTDVWEQVWSKEMNSNIVTIQRPRNWKGLRQLLFCIIANKCYMK